MGKKDPEYQICEVMEIYVGNDPSTHHQKLIVLNLLGDFYCDIYNLKAAVWL